MRLKKGEDDDKTRSRSWNVQASPPLSYWRRSGGGGEGGGGGRGVGRGGEG